MAANPDFSISLRMINKNFYPEGCSIARRIWGKRSVILSNAKDLFVILLKPTPSPSLPFRTTTKPGLHFAQYDDKGVILRAVPPPEGSAHVILSPGFQGEESGF